MAITDRHGRVHGGNGEPNTGFYSPMKRDESDITLAEMKDWGTTGINVGSRSPWGAADDTVDFAPGITSVGTPSHGGIKLSSERNKAVHPALRSSNGWYEEDCEAYIVAFTFPEDARMRRAVGYSKDETAEEALERGRDGVRRWFPDAFEKATGETVLPGESSVRDEAVWAAAHAADFISHSASRDPEDNDYVIVTAHRGEETERFRIAADELQSRRETSGEGSRGRVVIDLDRDTKLPPVVAPPKVPTTKYTGIDTSGLTEVSRARADVDLSKRWRNAAGEVRTLREIVESGKISGKAVYVESGQRKYVLSAQENHGDSSISSYPVSKAVWDAVQAPDERTEIQRLSAEREILSWKSDRTYDRKTQIKLAADMAAISQNIAAAQAAGAANA